MFKRQQTTKQQRFLFVTRRGGRGSTVFPLVPEVMSLNPNRFRTFVTYQKHMLFDKVAVTNISTFPKSMNLGKVHVTHMLVRVESQRESINFQVCKS